MGRLEVSNIDCRQDGAALDPAWGRASYLFNPTIAGIERADALLIVGADPRREAAVLNARIRKRWRSGNFPIALIGHPVDLTYTYDYLGAGPDTLAELAAGRHAFADTLKKAAHPLILVGSGALARPEGAAVAALAAKAAVELGAVKEGWNGYGFLHAAAARAGALDIGFVPGPGGLSAPPWRKPARSTSFSSWAPTRSIFPPAPSWSISAPMATAAPTAPTSSCRARPIRKNPASTSIPRGGCRWRRAPPFRPAMRARIGRSCARCPTGWAINCPIDSLSGLRQVLFRAYPHLGRIDQIAPGDSGDIATAGGARGNARQGALRLAGR